MLEILMIILAAILLIGGVLRIVAQDWLWGVILVILGLIVLAYGTSIL